MNFENQIGTCQTTLHCASTSLAVRSKSFTFHDFLSILQGDIRSSTSLQAKSSMPYQIFSNRFHPKNCNWFTKLVLFVLNLELQGGLRIKGSEINLNQPTNLTIFPRSLPDGPRREVSLLGWDAELRSVNSHLAWLHQYFLQITAPLSGTGTGTGASLTPLF